MSNGPGRPHERHRRRARSSGTFEPERRGARRHGQGARGAASAAGWRRSARSNGSRATLFGRIPFTKLASLAAESAGKNQHVYVWADGKLYAPNGAVAAAASAPPTGGATNQHLFGQSVRTSATAIAGDQARIIATYPQAKLDSRISSLRWRVIGVIVAAILVIALLASLLVRSLTATLRVFASRARAVAQGDFDQQLPDEGQDEFATFARSFNTMAAELEQRIEELDGERRRVQEAVARFGQALVSRPTTCRRCSAS